MLSVLLAASFMTSWLPKNGLVESLIVLLYFPLLVSLGAGTSLTGILQKACVFFGKISYPLYMTHYGFIWWFGSYFTSHQVPQEHLPWILGAGTVAMVFFAWLVMVLYETPLRNFLTKKRKARLRQENTPS